MQTLPLNGITLRPSGAHRWVPCPGSVYMESCFPEDDSGQAALEGQAAHWVASETLDQYADGEVPCSSDFLGKQAPNGVVITEEMIDAVNVYIRDVIEVVGSREALQNIYVEHVVEVPCVHPNNRGTLDGGAHISIDRLVIWDFKYGWGIVDVYENWQLLDYALGVLSAKQAAGGTLPQEIELRVVQPRPYHPEGPARSWVVPLADMDRYCRIMSRAASEAIIAEGILTPGNHCDHCRARHSCPALQQTVFAARDYAEQALPDVLSGDTLSRELDFLNEMEKLVKARKSGIEAQALTEIKQGVTIPGWVAEAKPGRRKWAVSDAEVIELGNMAGVDLSKPGVKTPAQAEKSKLSKEMVDAFVTRDPGELKLYRRDPNKAEKVFSK